MTKRLGDVRLAGLTPELVPLVEVCGALVRGCLEAGRGVLVLAGAGEYGGITSVERSAWEMWNELEYLLLTPNPPRNGVKVQVNALIEVIGLLTVQKAPEGMLERNKAGLAKFESSHPDVVSEVREQRKKKRHHWSGESRSSVVGPTATSKAVYKMLSWETHPDIVSIRDVSAEIRDDVGYLEFSLTADADAIVERSASSTSECLLRAWNAFAHSFGQSKIEDAPPRKPA